MSKILNTIIDNCVNSFTKDNIIKQKIENDIINPIFIKGYLKLKPYLFILLYMYGIIVLLLIIIILLLILKKNKNYYV